MRSKAQHRVLLRWLLCSLFACVVSSPAAAGAPDPDYRGGLITPPLPKPQFTLTDTSGAPFNLHAETAGYVTLLFFGFTQCREVCPMHVGTLAAALKKLPASVANSLRVVFVTTDPAHDTPKVLRAWLDRFDRRIVGLSGSEAAVAAAQAAANIPVARKVALANGGSDFEHAAFVLAYTRDDFAHVLYPSGVTQEDWVHDLPRLVSEAWTSAGALQLQH
jgi:protein SCO1